MHGLEIIVVVLTMIFLETMFIINLYVNCVVLWRMPPISFFHFIIYIDERQVFNDTVGDFQPLIINLILFGSEIWNFETNMVLFRTIHRYIHVSKRFLISSLTLSLKLILKQILKNMYI